jgi:hypothetical protein
MSVITTAASPVFHPVGFLLQVRSWYIVTLSNNRATQKLLTIRSRMERLNIYWLVSSASSMFRLASNNAVLPENVF